MHGIAVERLPVASQKVTDASCRCLRHSGAPTSCSALLTASTSFGLGSTRAARTAGCMWTRLLCAEVGVHLPTYSARGSIWAISSVRCKAARRLRALREHVAACCACPHWYLWLPGHCVPPAKQSCQTHGASQQGSLEPALKGVKQVTSMPTHVPPGHCAPQARHPSQACPQSF